MMLPNTILKYSVYCFFRSIIEYYAIIKGNLTTWVGNWYAAVTKDE